MPNFKVNELEMKMFNGDYMRISWPVVLTKQVIVF